METHLRNPKELRNATLAKLLGEFRHIKIFEPDNDYLVVNRYKDGSFYFSSTGIALYFNGFNPRSDNDFARYGLLWHDGKTIFPLGYFMKPGEENNRGYLMVGCPKGKNTIAKMVGFVNELTVKMGGMCSGIYVRFLDEKSTAMLTEAGWQLVGKDRHAWEEGAAKEDEEYNHSVVKLPSLLPGFVFISKRREESTELISERTKEEREAGGEARHALNQGTKLLDRNGLSYVLQPMARDGAALGKQIEEVKPIVIAHFEELKKMGKAVGSTWQDYVGVLSQSILQLRDVYAYMGYVVSLGSQMVPISVFVGEQVANETAGLYCSITDFRNGDKMLERLGISPEEMVDNVPRLIQQGDPAKVQRNQGIKQMGEYARLSCLAKLNRDGIVTVKLGGSELPDLDRAKKKIGAMPDPTNWMFYEIPLIGGR